MNEEPPAFMRGELQSLCFYTLILLLGFSDTNENLCYDLKSFTCRPYGTLGLLSS